VKKLVVGLIAGMLLGSAIVVPAYATDGGDDTVDESSQYESQLLEQAASAGDAVPGDIAAEDAAEHREAQDEALAKATSPDGAAIGATAASSDFTPGELIADVNFYDKAAMSEVQIQSFLATMVGSCANSLCLAQYRASTPNRTWSYGTCAPYVGASNESAARIIFKVQVACGLSAKVILVTLQKEQSLLTNPAPSADVMRKAMGYGCPDTAECDSTYYGFFNQVYAAARQLTWYGKPGGSFTWLKLGQPNHVLFHPDAARCGGTNVTIANRATAALYYYTPYQPNSAALANLYGEGDSCSSYGNRNFWRMYSDWFGDPRDGVVLSMKRLQGPDRYATAVAISQDSHTASGVPVVYIASGTVFADALAAAPAAAHEGGPMLLVTRDSVPKATFDELVRLAPEEIVIVGGVGAVGASVMTTLAQIAPTGRIDGDDRYATSRNIFANVFDSTAIAYLATGRDFPDGLTAGAAAGALGAPVVLVDGITGNVDAETVALLKNKGVSEVRIAGGIGAVSQGIESSLAASFTVKRYHGADRYATSVAINSTATSTNAFIATGADFPDALTGAVAAGAGGYPLYLARRSCVPGDVRATALGQGVTSLTVLGGDGVLTDAVGRLQAC
jgi:putative cell wall-binding protein